MGDTTENKVNVEQQEVNQNESISSKTVVDETKIVESKNSENKVSDNKITEDKKENFATDISNSKKEYSLKDYREKLEYSTKEFPWEERTKNKFSEVLNEYTDHCFENNINPDLARQSFEKLFQGFNNLLEDVQVQENESVKKATEDLKKEFSENYEKKFESSKNYWEDLVGTENTNLVNSLINLSLQNKEIFIKTAKKGESLKQEVMQGNNQNNQPKSYMNDPYYNNMTVEELTAIVDQVAKSREFRDYSSPNHRETVNKWNELSALCGKKMK